MNLAWVAAIMLAPQLTTRSTAAALAAETPLPEYPRPQLVREEWLNRNGMWDFAVTQAGAPLPTVFTQKIRVPYPMASHLSGIGRPLAPEEAAVYRREFEIPREWDGRRVLLHFGAVDWHAKVIVNETDIGEHFGGYYPFSIDILKLNRSQIAFGLGEPSTRTPWTANCGSRSITTRTWRSMSTARASSPVRGTQPTTSGCAYPRFR